MEADLDLVFLVEPADEMVDQAAELLSTMQVMKVQVRLEKVMMAVQEVDHLSMVLAVAVVKAQSAAMELVLMVVMVELDQILQ